MQAHGSLPFLRTPQAQGKLDPSALGLSRGSRSYRARELVLVSPATAERQPPVSGWGRPPPLLVLRGAAGHAAPGCPAQETHQTLQNILPKLTHAPTCETPSPVSLFRPLHYHPNALAAFLGKGHPPSTN